MATNYALESDVQIEILARLKAFARREIPEDEYLKYESMVARHISEIKRKQGEQISQYFSGPKIDARGNWIKEQE